MCLVPVPVPTSCPAAVTLLLEQIKALPRAQQQEVLEQLHNHIYHPFYAVLAGPDYRPTHASV